MTALLDAAGIRQTLDRLAGEIAAAFPHDCPIAIIGIRRRGDELARRLLRILATRTPRAIQYGCLDITLYRDDLAEVGPAAVVRTTEIDFDVSGTYLILVDDVIYTGRSIRAALAALIDLGRPRAIKLAVLVDRGGRELPIQPDFVGITARDDRRQINVHLTEPDGRDEVTAA